MVDEVTDRGMRVAVWPLTCRVASAHVTPSDWAFGIERLIERVEIEISHDRSVVWR